jgi:Hint module
VQVQDRGVIPLSQLNIGDYVQVASPTTITTYSQVYGFGHYDPDTTTEFIQIMTLEEDKYNPNNMTWGENKNNYYYYTNRLEISARHLVFTSLSSSSSGQQQQRVGVQMALEIQVNDSLLNAQYQPQRVVTIRTVQRQGIYAPLTQSGDILVSGIHASNFIQMLYPTKQKRRNVSYNNQTNYEKNEPPVNYHQLGQLYILPYQFYCTMLHTSSTCQDEVYDNGYSTYVSSLIQLGNWIHSYDDTNKGSTLLLTSIVYYGSIPLVHWMNFMMMIVTSSSSSSFRIVSTTSNSEYYFSSTFLIILSTILWFFLSRRYNSSSKHFYL